MGRSIGCILLLAVVAWLGLEVWTWLAISQGLNRAFASDIGSGGYLLTSGWIVITLIIGIKLARFHISRVMVGLMNGTAGRHVLGAAGGVLLALPGFLSDIPGILLLLPPIQALLGTLGAAILASVVKRSMGKLFGGGGFSGGGAGGFPGGSPGGGAGPGIPGPFPGMKPLTPDDKARFNKPGKTYDTTVEKD